MTEDSDGNFLVDEINIPQITYNFSNLAHEFVFKMDMKDLKIKDILLSTAQNTGNLEGQFLYDLEKGVINYKDNIINIDNVTTLKSNKVVTGVTKSLLDTQSSFSKQDAESIKKLEENLAVSSFNFKYEDASLMPKLPSFAAMAKNKSIADFKNDLKTDILQPDPEISNFASVIKLRKQILVFIDDPKSLINQKSQ